MITPGRAVTVALAPGKLAELAFGFLQGIVFIGQSLLNKNTFPARSGGGNFGHNGTEFVHISVSKFCSQSCVVVPY